MFNIVTIHSLYLQIHEVLNYTHETLYISVHLVDLYMQTKIIKKTELQLVGATCMWIASKFEVSFETF